MDLSFQGQKPGPRNTPRLLASSAAVLFLLFTTADSAETQTVTKAHPSSFAQETYDVVVVGATPAGIAAALAAARLGSRVALVDPFQHVGGMFTGGGMCYSDLWMRNSEGAIFREYTRRVREYYAPHSNFSSADFSYVGYFWEPSVAEKAFNQMLEEEPLLSVLLGYRLSSVSRKGSRLVAVRFETPGGDEELLADVFIDATYEGDLAASAGVEYRVGREGRADYNEQHAGVIYQDLVSKKVYPESTGRGDGRVQAYNFLLVITDKSENRIPLETPNDYERSRYLSLLDDLRSGHVDGIHDIYTFIPMPGNKFALNNSYKASVSADFPGENWGYPEADQQSRQRIIQRHLNHTLGLLYFLQTDPEVPTDLRQEAQRWGLAANEFIDNGHLPWQMYVREARRIVGEYTFTESDGRVDPKNQLELGMSDFVEPPWMYPQFPNLPKKMANRRPPIHSDSVAVATYFFDSHATSPWEPGHEEGTHVFEGVVHLEHLTLPSQLPYRIMVPKEIEGLLVPVAVSATHIGFSTIRMEPVWMALGQAAGTAAFLASSSGATPREIPVKNLQLLLLRQEQVLTFLVDVPPDHEHFQALQYFGTKGFFPTFTAFPDSPITRRTALQWLAKALRKSGTELGAELWGTSKTPVAARGNLTRAEALAWTKQAYEESYPALHDRGWDQLLADTACFLGSLTEAKAPITRSEFSYLLYQLEVAAAGYVSGE